MGQALIMAKPKRRMTIPANRESLEIKRLFKELGKQEKRSFPKKRQALDAPSAHGVYIIRTRQLVLHVGRTLRGKKGLYQRLKDHLYGASSFTNEYLRGDGAVLRQGEYTYQYLELADPRKRALLEAYTIGILCPEHIGLGEWSGPVSPDHSLRHETRNS